MTVRSSRSIDEPPAKNVSANLLANAWSTALALLLTPWYVRLLGVESYALIGFYVSWVAMLGILDTGISATALREIAWLWARPDDRRQAGTLLRSLEVSVLGNHDGPRRASCWRPHGGSAATGSRPHRSRRTSCGRPSC